MATFEEFKRLDMRVAKIKEVEDHPNADKLYVIVIELEGKTKQIVAGIKNSYKKEDLIGRQVVMVDNLGPAMLRGVESQGMILASSDESGMAVVVPDKEMKLGSVVK